MPVGRWATIETSAGVYNAAALTALDNLITFQRQNNASVYFGVYATPTFYASASVNPTYADNVTKGPWGLTGECANPTSLTALGNFVTMIVNRYNKPGGAWYNANFATLGKGIQYWEPWNEPSGSGGNGNSTGSGATGSGYWWGTVAQLVDVCQTQYAAIKALDPSITVTTPGYAGSSKTYALSFLQTTGPSTNKTGLQSCEAYAFHPYQHGPYGAQYGSWGTNDLIFGNDGVRGVLDWMRINNVAMPLWISEWGVDAGSGTATEIAWYAAPASVRYQWMARCLMTVAAMGVKCIHPWHWEETSTVSGNSGAWQTDTTGVTLAYNDFATKASGKTITKAQCYWNGIVSLTFSDGTNWTV